MLIIPVDIFSQVSQEWLSRYNHNGDSTDYGWAVAADNSGNVFVAGQVYDSVSKADMCLIKYNVSGAIQWLKTFNGPADGDDFADAVLLDEAGNIYITGSAERPSTGADFCTIKFDPSGNTQWINYYNGIADSSDQAFLLALDSKNNLYVSGSIKGNASDMIVIKYDASGNEQWVRTNNGPANGWDRSNSIAVDDSDNVYVMGFITTVSSSLDYCTIKYSSDGVQQWIRTYNGTGNNFDLPNAMVLDDSANIYITGTSAASNSDFLTIKYDRNGNVKWIQRYNGPANNTDAGSGIAVDNEGNVYAFGESIGAGSDFDWLLIKYNASGAQQWLQRYNGPANSFDDADDILTDSKGNIYVMGASTGIGSSLDYLVMKYDPSGSVIWEQRYNGTGNDFDFPASIFRDGQNNIYLTGNSMNGEGNMDIVTIKYSQTVNITSISSLVPHEFILHQNYPNPFNPATTIEFAIPRTADVKLSVYNVSGKEIERLLNENLAGGEYKIEWNASGIPGGIYFYRIEASGFIDTRKAVLVK